jgi:hypothetical protein
MTLCQELSWILPRQIAGGATNRIAAIFIHENLLLRFFTKTKPAKDGTMQ